MRTKLLLAFPHIAPETQVSSLFLPAPPLKPLPFTQSLLLSSFPAGCFQVQPVFNDMNHISDSKQIWVEKQNKTKAKASSY